MRVDVPGRESDRLVVGTSPLRAKDDAGRQAAVDLDLEDTGADFEPQNSAADVALPKKLEHGIAVGEVRIFPEAPAPGDAPASKTSDERLVYPNSGADTDTALIPLSTGVESFTQLRSPASPESSASVSSCRKERRSATQRMAERRCAGTQRRWFG